MNAATSTRCYFTVARGMHVRCTIVPLYLFFIYSALCGNSTTTQSLLAGRVCTNNFTYVRSLTRHPLFGTYVRTCCTIACSNMQSDVYVHLLCLHCSVICSRTSTHIFPVCTALQYAVRRLRTSSLSALCPPVG